jgi:hypothetical protein
VFEPDVEVVWAADIPDMDVYRGLARLEDSLREWFSVWDSMRMQAEQLIDLGEQVLVLLTAHGRGKGSTVETEGRYAHLWTMRDGRATRIVGYTDWDSARRDAEL